MSQCATAKLQRVSVENARVTIRNYYQYRHVDKPGWNLGWTWANNEVIWSMRGAFATDMGNCSSYKSQIPHSCRKDPVIADLMLDQASPENMTEGCCRGGVLYPWAINPANSFSSFEVQVGNQEGNAFVRAPKNLALLAPGPGYSCGPLLEVEPTVSSDIGGRRQVPVFRTWKSTCTYSSFLANKIPMCCVSLSTFYNPAITACPNCSCGCRDADKSTDSCISEGNQVSRSSIADNVDIVKCTYHMCPIRVHWHIKNNYMDHWRVKLTVSNYNYRRNYTDWNVLVQHPNFKQLEKTFSFNSTLLPAVGLGEGTLADEVALFWGLKFYNDELLNADEDQLGSVSTEILLKKDLESFTLRNGWALPRRIYFNGEYCQMPPPDNFPILPNGSAAGAKQVTQAVWPETAVAQVEKRPISTILIIIAMQTEALPVVNKFQLTEDPHPAFPPGVPWVRYYGNYKDLQINLIWPGKDSYLGVDSVGTVSASLVTYASVQALKPDLIINAGTAGGFKAKGAGIGDVYLASAVAFHDRRIPIPVFDLYGVGLRHAFSTSNLLKELNLKVGKLSTGDSLDMTPQDEASITANDATIKDMEGAAVAYVADLFKVPTIFVKAVTDIVDGEKPTAEEFLQNLAAVTAALEQSVTQVIEYISGKSLSEL
ncbi:COBRA-like protein [Parasponia andersonii]|uniref:COBRA-like protein n=1 Tax=Parasponia andersonii TaxID=3476 RepID=A0A2P5C284_PARAD|nr:COBRA-like protein [Parasponia andersonii]